MRPSPGESSGNSLQLQDGFTSRSAALVRIPLVGPSYQSQSLAADCQRTVNWYPESIESGDGKSRIALYPTPGLKYFTLPNVSAGPTNGPNGGLFSSPTNRLFSVGN